MILVTKATGVVGQGLIPRLIRDGHELRCIVNDPQQLGRQRAQTQLVIGDLLDPWSYRHAFRGVDTVIHLDCPTRSYGSKTLEELNGVATWNLAKAASGAGVKRFILLSALGASPFSGSRYLRARYLAEDTVKTLDLDVTTLATSLLYAPGKGWVKRLERFAKHAPLVPVPGFGCTRAQPIAADDVAAAIANLLMLPKADKPQKRYELAGPERLSYDQVVQKALKSLGIRRPVLPTLAVIPKHLIGTRFVTDEEVKLVQEDRMTDRGIEDCLALGVEPLTMSQALAVPAATK